MRFYEIQITDESGAVPGILSGTGKTDYGFPDGKITSFVKGRTTPGALNLEFDIPVVSEDIPVGNAYIRLWGVGIDMVNAASTLNNSSISIRAGMQMGFPLANLQVSTYPPRNGVIFNGTIFQAFGNWQGIEQTLDLIVTTQLGVANSAKAQSGNSPIIFTCPAGTSMQAAISQTLLNMGIKSPSVNVSDKLRVSSDASGYYRNVNEFAQAINDLSRQIITDPNYKGVKVIKTDTGYKATDNTTPGDASSKIVFTDLIGQPVWLDLLTVQIKVVMRSDIRVGDTVEFDTSKINISKTAKSFSQLKNDVVYTGKAWVSSVRHIGNFRQPDANSWVSIINLIPDTVTVKK